VATTNVFQELKDALDDLKKFLEENAATVGPAIKALAEIVPPVNTLIDELISLLETLKSEIGKLNVGGIAEEQLKKLPAFAKSITTMLNAAKTVLPDEASDINEVIGAVNLVGSVPSLDQVKEQVILVIDDIVALLSGMKA
jgi:hypothetical protein